MSKVERQTRVERIREWATETWYAYTYRSPYDGSRWNRWKYATGQTLCSLGIHRITFWADCTYWEPPEPYWHCERCAHERLPYRAIFWKPWVWTLRHPILALRNRDQGR